MQDRPGAFARADRLGAIVQAYQASLSKRIRSTFSDFSLFSAATKQQQTIAVQVRHFWRARAERLPRRVRVLAFLPSKPSPHAPVMLGCQCMRPSGGLPAFPRVHWRSNPNPLGHDTLDICACPCVGIMQPVIPASAAAPGARLEWPTSIR